MLDIPQEYPLAFDVLPECYKADLCLSFWVSDGLFAYTTDPNDQREYMFDETAKVWFLT
jgi:hypothetical protein